MEEIVVSKIKDLKNQLKLGIATEKTDIELIKRNIKCFENIKFRRRNNVNSKTVKS